MKYNIKLFKGMRFVRSTMQLSRALFIGIVISNFTTLNAQQLNSSWQLGPFIKVDSLNPILKPSPDLIFTDPVTGNDVRWEKRNVLNPTAVVRNGKVYLLYRAQDETGTSRIGMAVSDDGLHFQKLSSPVFYPDRDAMFVKEWHFAKGSLQEQSLRDLFDGVEDPRIVESEDGTYLMTYTSYDGKTARLCFASSKDLKTWTKHGLVLKDPAYRDLWAKSGAIVCSQFGHRMVAQRINGKYWMYFGDTDIFLAYSEDLMTWTAATDQESDRMISVLHPRRGKFDSRLVEPGPFALLTSDGIILIYNGSNAANFNDSSLPSFTYSAGQALFDRDAPWNLIDRSDKYFITPDKPYERIGEVNEVCFVEGLVFFNDAWYLYYGTADSRIAVAKSSAH